MSVGSHRDRDLVEIRAGDRKVKVTLDHPILTPVGVRPAGDLGVGDKVMTVEPRRLCRDRGPVHEGYELGYVLGAVGSDASIQDGGGSRSSSATRRSPTRFAAALEVAFDLGRERRGDLRPSGFLQREIPMFRVASSRATWPGSCCTGSVDRRRLGSSIFPRVVLRSQEMMQGFLDGYCDGDGTEMKVRRRRRSHDHLGQ